MINWFNLIFSSVLLGVGLAMDAFSVSLANGLNEPCMKLPRMGLIAGIFAFFQCAMPLIGWVCIHTIAQRFTAFQKFIPWIALALLGYIGGKMLYEGIKCKGEADCDCECGCGKKIGFTALVVQGIATSIDALSVGFTIAEYDIASALLSALVIAAVTFVICMGGIIIGRKVGMRFADKAGILGGAILVIIGITIFVRGII